VGKSPQPSISYQKTQALNNKATSQTFDNNSLSGETTGTGDSRADEIAAFRDG